MVPYSAISSNLCIHLAAGAKKETDATRSEEQCMGGRRVRCYSQLAPQKGVLDAA
jgi:hypothetical protein